MGFKEHKSFKKPENINTKIWRYQKFPKLLDVLETKSLYFCRADLFEDSLEGIFPEKNLERIKNANMSRFDELDSETQKKEESLRRSLDKQNYNFHLKAQQYARESNFVNCWHVNDDESDLMWKKYTDPNQGICFQSTYKKLCESIEIDENAYVGLVTYLDFLPDDHLFTKLLNKRIDYEHEKELRSIVWKTDWFNILNPWVLPKGIHVKVNLENLIERIIITPSATPEFKKKVTSKVREYSSDIPIVDSDLNEK